MATMLDRLREGLIWSYAALTLVDERRTKGQQWWEQEGVRLREEARARLDEALRTIEERRTQRTEWMSRRTGWMKERVRAGLSDSGVVATSDQLAGLQARIDELTARVAELQAQSGENGAPAGTAGAAETTGTPHIVLPSGSPAVMESAVPPDITPAP